MSVLKMNSMEDSPSSEYVPTEATALSVEERREVLMKVSMKIVERWSTFTFHPYETDTSVDQVNAYAKNLLSLGLFYMEFVDSIKEGNGSRVLRCWKYLLPVFKSSQRKNHSIEVLHFLYEYTFLASPMHCHQMLWSRFVNTCGRPGTNIPADLHMEHLNRILKEAGVI